MNQDNFATLPGLIHVKRAMEIAVAGNHSITVIDCNGYDEQYTKAFHDIGGEVIHVIKPCPCGNLSHPNRTCVCSFSRIKQYRARVKYQKALQSDIVIESGYIRERDFDTKHNEVAAAVLERIRTIVKVEPVLTPDAQKLFDRAYSALKMNARDRDTALQIAVTIAGLDKGVMIETRYIAEAVQYIYKNN